MSYKMPKLTDKRKLCPRCGSPMMIKGEATRYCPVCHFSASAATTVIKIKMEEDEAAEAAPKIELLRITKSGTTKETNLESDYSYVIVDRKSNTLWIWKGSASSPGDAYKAGVETTRLKSSLKMYSAQIKRVEEGEEPDAFPALEAEVKVAEEEKRKIAEEMEEKRVEEERRRLEEEERRQKEEEDRRRLEEEEEQKHKEELQRMKEEELKRIGEIKLELEKEESKDLDVWTKVVEGTKPAAEVIEEKPSVAIAGPIREPEVVESAIDEKELNEAISSLTLVRGINEEIATALFKAHITTIMELSLGDPEELAEKSGLELSVVNEIVGNAKDLLGFD
ncbi:MAG: hypothetical protein HWN66_11065 [Candidatus Helarchaeota archaeon]|nr:hypothetical protein [Candidatus Helarchaeota archaeon]